MQHGGERKITINNSYNHAYTTVLVVVAATVANQEQLQATPSAHTYQTQPDGNRLLVDQSPLQYWMVGEEGGGEGEEKVENEVIFYV